MCIFYAFFNKIFSKVSKSINSKATQAESDSQMTIPTPHKTTSKGVGGDGRCSSGWPVTDLVLEFTLQPQFWATICLWGLVLIETFLQDQKYVDVKNCILHAFKLNGQTLSWVNFVPYILFSTEGLL